MVARIRYEDLAALARGRQSACGPVTVIAVDGPSGAGKSELADGIAKMLGATVLRVDELVHGWRALTAMPPVLARDVLAPMAVGQPAAVRRWDWARDTPGDLMHLRPERFLVLDGCGSGSRVVRPFLSLLVWVDAPPPVRYERAMARDGAGYEPWWDAWAEQERELFAAEGTQAAADIRLTSGLPVASWTRPRT